jgi:hypothetical protein
MATCDVAIHICQARHEGEAARARFVAQYGCTAWTDEALEECARQGLAACLLCLCTHFDLFVLLCSA